MWVPPVGVRSVTELWTRHLEQLESAACGKWHAPLLKLFYFSERTIKRYSSFKTDLNTYFDKEPPFQVSETFLSGSWSEGLFLHDQDLTMELPDMDFMCVLKNISYSQEDLVRGCLSVKEDTPFVYAFIPDENKLTMWGDYLADEVHSEYRQRLSSKKLKEKLEKNCEYIGNLFRHQFEDEKREKPTDGAAITIRKSKPTKSYTACFTEGFLRFGEPVNETTFSDILESVIKGIYDICYTIVPSSDIVMSISCEGWPSCAREWITRERRWPDAHSVEEIVQSGFHIVPKSSADGDFRLSFSCAETRLIQSTSPLQHKVMRAFKAVVKYHQNTWSPNLKDAISSYYLKTIAFWHFEKVSQESWTEETLIHHLVILLEDLAEAIRKQHLPMYFMPKVNIFKCIDDTEVVLELVQNVLEISRNFCAISEAVKKVSISRYFKTWEHRIKMLFRKLNDEHKEKSKSSSEATNISLWTICKAIEKM